MKLTIQNQMFNVVRLGEDKLLLQKIESKAQSQLSVPMIGQSILETKISNISNLVASESELLIYCLKENQENLLRLLIESKTVKVKNTKKVFKLDVCFELGLDWELVCSYLEKSQAEIIDLILDGSYQLINYGFQPGFMYLNGLDSGLHVPRLDSPRLKVPSGSIALGGKYIGVYGNKSPGGWNIIGQSSHDYKASMDSKKMPRIGQEIKINQMTKEKYLRKHKNE